MSQASVRPDTLYAWSGSSLLVVNTRGECAEDQRLAGYYFYFRETRFLRTLHLRINGHRPWPCEAASIAPDTHPRVHLRSSRDYEAQWRWNRSGWRRREHGLRRLFPERAVDIRVIYVVRAGWLDVRTVVAQRRAQAAAIETRVDNRY